MRISTQMMYEQGSGAINRRQAELQFTQQQIATGRRMLTAADDPVAAAAALRTSQGLASTTDQQSSQRAALASLAIGESTLGSVGDLLQSSQQLLIQGQSAVLKASDRASIAQQLDAALSQLVSLANQRDGNNAYLFAGFAETSQPFSQAAGGVVYQGDDGVRALEVAPGRLLGVSASGADTFMRVKTGNGVFATSADPANTGGGMMDSGRVASPAALDGHAYRIDFNVSGGLTTYDVVDTTLGTAVSAGNAFSPGTEIAVAGMAFTIKGQPAAGDRFTAAPSTNQSMFQTLADAAAALRASDNPGLRVSRLTASLANLDQAFDKALIVRSDFGGRMAELDALATVTSAATLQHQTRLSELQDLDYAQATSRFAQQQTALEASQQSFAKVIKLSLFNYIA